MLGPGLIRSQGAEIRFVLHDTFEFLDEEAELTSMEGKMEMEDPKS